VAMYIEVILHQWCRSQFWTSFWA